MNQALMPVFYLPPITWFATFLNTDNIILEQYENFPKQTYRNRAVIYGANGRLPLIIPIRHNGKRQMHELEISYAENWQKIHWKSIKTAYQGAPYFEYYEDKLEQIYHHDEKSLLKFNLNALEAILALLKVEKAYSLNQEYREIPEGRDLRADFSAKTKESAPLEAYYQTFRERYGFLSNLSVVDLLCNLGPESLSYLKQIKI